jgi:16S rRNA (adenine1518-N6/adenine1519-N6)-dimethyltransferase
MIPAKKSLGQNFLKSKEALRALVAAGNITNEDIILEVGPGKGVLTAGLLLVAKKVIAVEKDDRLIELLIEKFNKELAENKLVILNQDILEFNPESLRKEGEHYKIIANIPYYITGTFIQKFLETSFQPTTMVLMLQKEVAQRIATKDGKESILSMSVKAYGTPKYIMTVKAKYFSPAPNVDSAIIAVYDISKKFFSNFTEQKFFEIMKLGFAHKRKMLVGNLSETFPRETVEKILKEKNINEKVRAEDISLTDWKKIIESF